MDPLSCLVQSAKAELERNGDQRINNNYKKENSVELSDILR